MFIDQSNILIFTITEPEIYHSRTIMFFVTFVALLCEKCRRLVQVEN